MIVNWSFYLGGSDTFACEIKFSVNPSNNNNNYLLVRRAPPIRLRGHILREISLTTTTLPAGISMLGQHLFGESSALTRFNKDRFDRFWSKPGQAVRG